MKLQTISRYFMKLREKKEVAKKIASLQSFQQAIKAIYFRTFAKYLVVRIGSQKNLKLLNLELQVVS